MNERMKDSRIFDAELGLGFNLLTDSPCKIGELLAIQMLCHILVTLNNLASHQITQRPQNQNGHSKPKHSAAAEAKRRRRKTRLGRH